MATIAELGGLKSPGLLVQSGDWNSIVNEVARLDTDKANQSDLTALQSVVATLSGALTALQATVATLSTTVTTLDTRVTSLETIRSQFYLMTLESPLDHYALGSVAEIVARLHDLDGNAQTFSSTGPRPWVDFVTSWGALQAVPGFETRTGADGRALSVHVDATGVARVRLRAASLIADGDQVVLQQVMNRMVTPTGGGTPKTVESLLVSASTPAEARSNGAFAVLDAEYSSSNAPVRRAMDTLFRDEQRSGFHVAVGASSFTDYRATVMAFVKADNDPRTPDATRGAGTTQIAFREWTQVFGEPPVVAFPDHDVPQYWYPPLHHLPELVDLDNIVDNVHQFVDNVLDVTGEIDRHRRVTTTINWLDQVRGGESRPDALDAIDQAKGTLGMIAELDRGRMTPGEGTSGVGSLVKLAGRGENRANVVHGLVNTANARTAAVEGSIGDMRQQVATLGGQVAATVAEGGTIHMALQQVGSLNTRVDGIEMDRFVPAETLLRDLRVQVSQATERIVRLERP